LVDDCVVDAAADRDRLRWLAVDLLVELEPERGAFFRELERVFDALRVVDDFTDGFGRRADWPS